MIYQTYVGVDVHIGGSTDILQLGETVGRLDINQSPVDSILVIVIVNILVLVVRLPIVININSVRAAQVKLPVDNFVNQVHDLGGFIVILERFVLWCGLYLADDGGGASEIDVEGGQVLWYSCKEGNDSVS